MDEKSYHWNIKLYYNTLLSLLYANHGFIILFVNLRGIHILKVRKILLQFLIKIYLFQFKITLIIKVLIKYKNTIYNTKTISVNLLIIFIPYLKKMLYKLRNKILTT